MDGYEYERKVLWPIWNKERDTMIQSQNASSDNTRERLKNELGIEIKEQRDLSSLGERMLKNPDNFYPELSPDNNIWDLGRRFRNQR
jgi:hypothetical protein